MSMSRFLYALLASFIIFSFFNFNELDKAKAALVPDDTDNHQWLHYQWVVAGANEPGTGKDITGAHASEVWQFLKGNGFILFNNQIIDRTGEWEVKDATILIQIDGKDEKEIFRIEKRSRNELLLLSKDLKVRLLKLDEV